MGPADPTVLAACWRPDPVTDPDAGALYPPLRDIRKISLAIAVSVAAKAYELKLPRRPRPRDLRRSVQAVMYQP